MLRLEGGGTLIHQQLFNLFTFVCILDKVDIYPLWGGCQAATGSLALFVMRNAFGRIGCSGTEWAQDNAWYRTDEVKLEGRNHQFTTFESLIQVNNGQSARQGIIL